MSLPWFPFYVDDFLASPKVRRMDAESVGVYLLLLCEQWQAGPLPESAPDELAPIMRTQCERIADVLHACFERTADGWVNPRLRMVQREQEEKSAKARKAAKARWDKGSDADALQTQSGRNAIQNQNQIESQKKKEKGPPPEVRSIYGWEGGEGTDPLLMKAFPEAGDRDRCLRIAWSRIEAEDKDYHGAHFRAVLVRVVEEQSTNGKSGKKKEVEGWVRV